jgi:pimeloyl-ACP methyl ester carboxylesterase
MGTYVLVHGAWGGAHTWRSVRPILWAAGHQVFTPSLTGIGERAHLVSPHVDLSVHVDDVVNQVLYEDLTDIVLVGFSYGGMVVTGALAHIGSRVRELVYLDAFVPADGQALTDLTGMGGPAGERQLGVPWLVPLVLRQLDDPAAAQWADLRRTDQPVRTFTEKVHLPKPLEDYPFGRTYIKALGDPRTDPPDVFYQAADRYRDHPRWRYREHPSNHMIPANDPAGLADLLLELA